MGAIGLPEVIAGLIILALNAYALLAGAEFGGGVWDLLASGPRKQAQRELIAESIAPIWEANHVWLIIVVVMLFTAFPSAFSTLGIVLHIPISLVLIGIVLRGSAFVFRSYGSRTKERRETWGLAFSIASTIVPLILGAMIGAIAGAAVGDAAERVGTRPFAEVFIAPWTSFFPVIVGVFALVLFAMLAAVYATLAAQSDELRDDFRKRALISSGIAALLTVLALFFFGQGGVAGGPADRLLKATWSGPLHLVTGIASLTTIVALWTRRFRAARVGAAVHVSCVIWGWALAQFPNIIPTEYAGLTIHAAAAPRATLDLLLIGLIGGAVVLIPSLAYLYRTFARSSSALSNQSPHGSE
jgi:cytochrome d ubiquinol oxidase subunit II